MYQLELRKNEKPILVSNRMHELAIHVWHSSESYEDILRDVYEHYVVFEYAGNYPIVHLVSSSSADSALQEVYDYIIEYSLYSEDEEAELDCNLMNPEAGCPIYDFAWSLIFTDGWMEDRKREQIASWLGDWKVNFSPHFCFVFLFRDPLPSS